MYSFSKRQGYSGPVAEISIRHKAPEALRAKVVSIGYQHGLASCEPLAVTEFGGSCR